MMLAAALAAVLVPGAFAMPAVKADTVADVIKNHANLTTFATSLGSANLLSFLGEQPPFAVLGYVVLAPSDAAFAALPAAAKAMFDVASLRYELLAHHINLNDAHYTPNTVCASASFPAPGYQVTTAASQHLTMACYNRPGPQGPQGPFPFVSADQTLGNADFFITATPILASNGAVVVLDGVLLPAWLPPANAPINPAPPANNEPIVFRTVGTTACGQVDAASSVPAALYEDEVKLKGYISETLEYFYVPDGLTLGLGTCAEAGFTTKSAILPPVTTPWTAGYDESEFAYFCASANENTNYGAETSGCGCVIGLCPAVPPPDKPICAVCNAVLNRPRNVTFYVRGDTPPPPPPPDIFGFVLDVLRKSPELSTLYNVVQGAATKDSTGRPYERECPRGGQSADCSIPSEEPDGRQTFPRTIEEKGPWTFFAPDNAAFAKAPARTAALLAGWQGGHNELFLDNNFDTLYYHLLPGNFSAAQLPNGESNTLLGADLTTSHLGKGFTFVTGGNITNVARVKESIQVTNGVVHIISAVLIPPADTRRSKQQGYNTCCAASVGGSCCVACCKGGNIQCC